MKRCRNLTALLITLLLMFSSVPSMAAAVVGLYLDGSRLASDVTPVIIGGRTLVPLRVIGEALGAEVVYTSNSAPIVMSKGNDRVEVSLNKTRAYINGQPVTLDVPAGVISGRTMVPLRFISESLGAEVAWVSSPPSVHISSPVGQMSAAEVIKAADKPTGLMFMSSKPIRLGKPTLGEDKATYRVPVANVEVQPESVTWQPGQSAISGYSVQATCKGEAEIRLALGEQAPWLMPQVALGPNGQSLSITWPYGLKQMQWEQTGGVERLKFSLPSAVIPQIIDTTITVSAEGSLKGEILRWPGSTAVINVRSVPSTEKNDPIDKVNQGDTVSVIGETTGWYKVKLANGTEGWIADWLVGVETNIEEPDGVNVRSGPGTTYSRLATIHPPHKITVLERKDGWCRVNYGGTQDGWIADFLVPLSSRFTAPATVPGLRLFFPGMVRDQAVEWQPAASSHVAAAAWEDGPAGTTLIMQLKRTVSYRLEQNEQGQQLTFGNLVSKLALTSNASGARLGIDLDGSAKATVRYSAEELKAVITIPNAALAAGVPTSIAGDKTLIASVTAGQAGTDVRIEVLLTRQLAYHLSSTNGDAAWEVTFSSPTLMGKVIAIDPGHGATDPGALGTRGWHEKDFTHDIAYRLRDLLKQAGATVVMTREISSPPIYAVDRSALINAAGADAFVSIHINSYKTNVRGLETYYYPRLDNERFARLVHGELVNELGWPSRGVIPNTQYIMVKNTMTTGVLAEIGYISNPEEEAELLKPEVRQRIAEALFRAFSRYFSDEGR